VTTTRYRRRPDALWRRSLDAVVVLAAGNAEPVTLAATGPEVWELLAEWRTLDDLAAVLARTHGANPTTVAADVMPLLDELIALGAVDERADDPSRASK
jgi:hypothetical protein